MSLIAIGWIFHVYIEIPHCFLQPNPALSLYPPLTNHWPTNAHTHLPPDDDQKKKVASSSNILNIYGRYNKLYP